jgi:hypothetical protein
LLVNLSLTALIEVGRRGFLPGSQSIRCACQASSIHYFDAGRHPGRKDDTGGNCKAHLEKTAKIKIAASQGLLI